MKTTSCKLSSWRPLAGAGLLLIVAAVGPQFAGAAAVDLIPRELLFGNPSRTSPQLSPDGTMLAFLAPRDGVMNLWVCPIGKLDEARPLTAEKARPLRAYFWAHNGSDLLFVQDTAGDENFLLYAVNAKTGDRRKLTDFAKTRVAIYALSWSRPSEVVVGLNNRDARWHDAWLLNIETGALTLLHENKEQLSSYTLDDALRLRYASRSRPDGGWELLKFGADGAPLEVDQRIEYEDADNTSITGLTQDGRTLYMRDSRGRDKSVLKAVTVGTGTEKILAEDARADIGGALHDPVTRQVQAYRVAYIRSEWHVLDSSVAADFAFLNASVKGEWTPVSRSKDSQRWIVARNDAQAPGEFLLYDRGARTVSKLFTARPDLVGKPLVPMHGLEIKSRDGLTLVSYLTLPAGADANGDGRPEQPVPMVLLVHGGPWGRDGYGFNSMHQWLANRGYAVLSVNFRASTGFGKSFLRAGDKEWAGKMHDDLIDAVNWSIARRIAPKDKVAIMGGSYGGYATLVGLAFTPDVFACGVDIVGPANLQTLLSTIPPYWEAVRVRFARAIGDLNTDEGRKLLSDRSPLKHAGAIKRPLLIGQGANDPRVKQAESDQIVAAMKEKKIPVTYVLYPDEGHGFARPENSLSFNAITEAFLAHCLGGRFQPVGRDFTGASLKVLEGADQVPGLPEALRAHASQPASGSTP
jgi:dipeptidyl aminopeptidase/acylaminoacyl peptidase